MTRLVWREARRRAWAETIDLYKFNGFWKALQAYGPAVVALVVSLLFLDKISYATAVALVAAIVFALVMLGVRALLMPAKIAEEQQRTITNLEQADQTRREKLAHQEEMRRQEQFPAAGSTFERPLGDSHAAHLRVVVPRTTEKELHELIDGITALVGMVRASMLKNGSQVTHYMGGPGGRGFRPKVTEETVDVEQARVIGELFDLFKATDRGVCEQHLEIASALRDRLRDLHSTAHHIQGTWKALREEGVTFKTRQYALTPLYSRYHETAARIHDILTGMTEFAHGLRHRLD